MISDKDGGPENIINFQGVLVRGKQIRRGMGALGFPHRAGRMLKDLEPCSNALNASLSTMFQVILLEHGPLHVRYAVASPKREPFFIRCTLAGP